MKEPTVSDIRALLDHADPAIRDDAMDRYAGDARATVVSAVRAARRRSERAAAERDRLAAMGVHEEALRATGVSAVACVDEVGRGALAGPVTAAAVILPQGVVIEGLRDSKQLTPEVRERLAPQIVAAATTWSVAHVGADQIDRIGIAAATVRAMELALDGLEQRPGHVLVDGLDLPLSRPHTAIVRGDSLVRGIAAASILAKVTRDALMCALAETFPGYGLEDNKGYGSPPHLATLRERGPSPCHRLSFGPCSQSSLF